MNEGLIILKSFDLSIIVPHYENILGLERLLNSIKKLPRLEVIVVDDYSSSACFEQLCALQAQYVFDLYKNTGVKSAGTCRNIGLKKACGKYVLFADSDDFFLDTLIEQVSLFLESIYDIIFFPPTSIYEETGEPATRHLKHVEKLNAYCAEPTLRNEFALRLTWHCPWSKLYKLDFLRQNSISFDEVVASNDVGFSLRSGLKAKNIGISKIPIYCSVSRMGSLEHSYSREILKARIKVAVSHMEVCEKLGYPEFGDKALEWFFLTRLLRVRDWLYLIKFSKKLKVFRHFNCYDFFKRSISFFYNTIFVGKKRKNRLLVIK